MSRREIVVKVKLNEKLFRRFALFDAFAVGKRWRLPAGFAAILIVCGGVCLLSGKPQAGLMCAVLAVIGLGMPAVYVGTYLWQVKKQSDAFGLKTPRAMYTVTLSPAGATVRNDYKTEPEVTLAWDKIFGAVRAKGAIYLYAVRTRAFILPNGQSDATDGELWALIKANLPANRISDRA